MKTATFYNMLIWEKVKNQIIYKKVSKALLFLLLKYTHTLPKLSRMLTFIIMN
jgi:hypothetical protein